MSVTNPDDSLDRLHRELGFKRLNPVWAKLEILLGLFAVAVGLGGGMQPAVRTGGDFSVWACLPPVLLITLGGYLALAGHRSHLYQSNNRLAAHLLSEFRAALCASGVRAERHETTARTPGTHSPPETARADLIRSQQPQKPEKPS